VLQKQKQSVLQKQKQNCILLLLLQNTVPTLQNTHFAKVKFCKLQNCTSVLQGCKTDFSWSLTSHIIEDVYVRCIDDNNGHVHDAHATLLTTAIHLVDHGEYSMMRRMNYDDGKSKGKGKGGMGKGKGKAALVRVMSDDNDNDDNGKGRGGSVQYNCDFAVTNHDTSNV
jgi:hypothetical protein